MRAMIDGAEEPLFLSSGGEDYFLSAFYFDEGEFRAPGAGLTYKSGGSMSAYKTHDRYVYGRTTTATSFSTSFSSP